MEKITAIKEIIKNQKEIKEVGESVIKTNLCENCRKKMIRNNLMNVPLYKVFSIDYHRQIDRTLCRRCKISIRKEMLSKNIKDNSANLYPKKYLKT